MNLYAWFWYHTEFWIKDPAERRPYTYLIRDFYHCHPILYTFILLWVADIVHRFIHFNIIWWIGITLGVLLGHLFWGNPWVKGQQEEPSYIEKGETND